MTLTQQIEELRLAAYSIYRESNRQDTTLEKLLDVPPELTESEYVLLVEIGILAIMNGNFREHITDETDVNFNELWGLLTKLQENANPEEKELETEEIA